MMKALRVDRRSEQATKPQIHYIEVLLIDCGFKSRAERNGWISAEVGREIKYLDELTVGQAGRVIELLKEKKDEQWEMRAEEVRWREGE